MRSAHPLAIVPLSPWRIFPPDAQVAQSRDSLEGSVGLFSRNGQFDLYLLAREEPFLAPGTQQSCAPSAHGTHNIFAYFRVFWGFGA